MVNWSAIDPWSWSGRLARVPGKFIPKSSILRIRRGPAKGMKWMAGSSLTGCWLGTYELNKQETLSRFVRPGMTVYDIGAQAGYYTLIFSRLVGPAGRVFAFEPCAENLHHLVNHVNINCLTNVRIVQAAVGKSSGLYAFTTNRGKCENRITRGDSPLMVSVVNLDSIRLPPPDLMKIDIEGGESEALLGATCLLSRFRPIVFVALHGAEHGLHCPKILRANGYKVFDLAGLPFDGESSTSEIYATGRS
jgi:FkbM family methyltransferase